MSRPRSGLVADEQPGSAATDAQFQLRATALLLLIYLVCAVWLAMRRGPWLDEIWTLWQSRHDLPPGEILHQRWLADFHPPLFSLAHWLASFGFGDALLPHRLLNLLALAWAAAFGALTWKHHPASRPLLLVYAVLLLSMPQALEYFAESRSYFAQIWLVFTVLAAAIVILDRDDDLDWRRDRLWALTVAATIVVALNLHYITSLLIGLVLAGLIGRCAWLGRRRWAAMLLGAAALGCIPLFAYLAAQSSYLAEDGGNQWVSTTTLQAARFIVQRVTASLRANLLVLAVAVAALFVSGAALLRRRWAGRPLFAPEFAARLVLAPQRRHGLLLLGAMLALFAVAMLAAHARQPLITGRYLLTFQVGVLAIVGGLAAEAVASRRVLFLLAISLAAADLVSQSSRTLGEERWDATARQVSQRVARCPSSAVYVTPMPRETPYLQNALPVLRWGYEWQGRRHGFAVIQLDLDDGVLPARTGRCPALLWIEHAGARIPHSVDEALRRLGLDSAPIDLPSARLHTGETGFVLELPYQQRIEAQ